MMARKTRSRHALALEMKLTGGVARKASIPLNRVIKNTDTASKRSVKHLMSTSSGKNSSSDENVQETVPQIAEKITTASIHNIEASLLSPTTTQKRVKSQESTPKGQKIAKQQPMSGDDLNESGKENKCIDTSQNPSMDENRNTVARGRYLLKQLSSSLSPKMTTITTSIDKRVSRYGRHQKQKENSDYVPVDLMRYVGNTPSKSKSKMDTIDSNTIEQTPEGSLNSEDTTDEGSKDISPLLDETPLAKVTDPIMFPMVQSEDLNLLGMEEIKIVGMNDSSSNTDDSKDNKRAQNLLERKISSDSAKGSSIDSEFLYTIGNLYWGTQSRKSIHWPCIVRADPETDQIIRLQGDKFLEIHVNYFGDRGRRGWIKEHFLIPFEGVDVYYNKAKNMEYGKPIKQALRSEMPKRWKNACKIAEKYIALPLEERIAKFDEEVKLELVRFKISRHQTAINVDKTKKEELALWKKRERSPSPESPAYELLPGFSSTMEKHPAKKRKLPAPGNAESASARSEVNGLIATISDVENSDNMENTECDDLITFINFNIFDGKMTPEERKKVEIFVQGICNLKKSHPRGRERTASRHRAHRLRKAFEMLGIETVVEVSNAGKIKIAQPVVKKEPKTLEEKFIFELDKKFLTKGVPRGFVCHICHRPNNVVKCNKCAQHVHVLCLTTEPEEVLKLEELAEQKNFSCADCLATTKMEKKCYICNDEIPEKETEQKYRCGFSKCTPEYHLSCLALFPQHRQINASTIICPYHACHTCVASEPQGKASMAKMTLAHCVKCPTSYHPSGDCIPAGSVLLTTTQLICPKHTLEQIPLNVNWCFVCGLGGNLICCETCPFACHRTCLPFTPPDGKYFCEECESGRMPLYNEIVIAKLGNFRWWPALTVPPSEIPQNLLQVRPKPSDICVKFFNSHDMAWLNRKRMYRYLREDTESLGPMKSGSTMEKKYRSAMAEASKIFKMLQARRTTGPFISLSTAKAAPMYTKIKTNRYIPPLKPPSNNRQLDGVEDSICRCQPTDDDPCGPTSACLNRAILMECSLKTCPAKERCSNQRFTKRMYPALEVRYFADKGFGLVALENVKNGQFVIEYVGEVINGQEFDRRVAMMQAAKEENYYFLTVEPDMTIDAGPKGNVSRFINHSCEPNCETQKWTIGETRVIGLFAIQDIQAGEELTFNYNLESLGNSKRVCLCGAEKCSGYIGEKYRAPQKKEPVGRIKSGRTMKSGKKKAKVRKAQATAAHKNADVSERLDDINVQSLDSDVMLIPAQETVTVDLVDENALTFPPTVVKIKQEKKDDSF